VSQLAPVGEELEQLLLQPGADGAPGADAPAGRDGGDGATLVKREQLLRRQLLDQLELGVRADVAREFDPSAKEFGAAAAARGEFFRH
jgi:hypothetical protein